MRQALRLLLPTLVATFMQPSALNQPATKRSRTAEPSATAPATLSLAQLLSTCVDAASRGCEEIRAVQTTRAASGMDVSYKSEASRDALTEADLRAQEAIVSALRAEWPDVTIVGEEDENNTAEACLEACATYDTPLRRDLSFPKADATVLVADVAVFVDPLDGTREFVEGRLENVQSLVGISVRGRAMAGAIGLPFPTGTNAEDTPACIVYGLVGNGAGCHGARPSPPEGAYAASGAPKPIVETGDSSNEVLAAAKKVALSNGGTAHIAGGAGRKILAAGEGLCDLSIQHFNTHLWDTCAPGAIAAALGGRVTDLFGAPLLHLPNPPSGSLKNRLGVVASAPSAARAHEALCAAMRADPSALAILAESTGQPVTSAHAADVARGLDDLPLRADALSASLTGGAGAALAAYVAPEASAFRGMMSDAVRLELTWSSQGPSSGASLPRSVFYKRVVMGELESARTKALSAPFKLQRDVQSYAIEAAFLNSAACKHLAAKVGVAVPTAYHVDLRPDDLAPIESRFSMLLADFAPRDGWAQSGLLGEAELKAALTSLAKLHGSFWQGSDYMRGGGTAELEACVWPAGGYWQPSMQPTDQWSDLDGKLQAHVAGLGDEFAEAAAAAGVRDLSALGGRLKEAAVAAAVASHPFDKRAVELANGGAGRDISVDWEPHYEAYKQFKTVMYACAA